MRKRYWEENRKGTVKKVEKSEQLWFSVYFGFPLIIVGAQWALSIRKTHVLQFWEIFYFFPFIYFLSSLFVIPIRQKACELIVWFSLLFLTFSHLYLFYFPCDFLLISLSILVIIFGYIGSLSKNFSLFLFHGCNTFFYFSVNVNGSHGVFLSFLQLITFSLFLLYLSWLTCLFWCLRFVWEAFFHATILVEVPRGKLSWRVISDWVSLSVSTVFS